MKAFCQKKTEGGLLKCKAQCKAHFIKRPQQEQIVPAVLSISQNPATVYHFKKFFPYLQKSTSTEENGTKFTKMTNCLDLPAALKCATWYQNTNMNTFAQNGAPSFFNPFSESNDLLRKLLSIAQLILFLFSCIYILFQLYEKHTIK